MYGEKKNKKIDMESQVANINKAIIQTDSVQSNQHNSAIQENNNNVVIKGSESAWHQMLNNETKKHCK